MCLLTSCKLNLTITSPGPDAVVASTSVPVTFELTGNSGPATFTCQLDLQAPVPCESGKLYENVSLGRHTLVVAATADGDKTQQTVAFHVVDTDPPLEIVRPVDGAVIQFWTLDTMIVRVSMELIQARPELKCQLDAQPLTRCETTLYGADPANQYAAIFDTFHPSVGSHVFTVSAWQNGQRITSDSVSFTFGSAR